MSTDQQLTGKGSRALNHWRLITVDDITAYGNDLRILGFSDYTIANYQRVLNKVPFPLPGTVREAKGWLADRREDVSLSSITFYVRALKSYRRWWAGEYGQDDPLDQLDYPKAPQPKPGRITPEADVDRALSMSPYSNDYRNAIRDKAIVSTFVFTGMRRGELVRLMVDDIDFENDL